jgi:hypothetical protein
MTTPCSSASVWPSLREKRRHDPFLHGGPHPAAIDAYKKEARYDCIASILGWLHPTDSIVGMELLDIVVGTSLFDIILWNILAVAEDRPF